MGRPLANNGTFAVRTLLTSRADAASTQHVLVYKLVPDTFGLMGSCYKEGFEPACCCGCDRVAAR
eukprot:1864720-Pyramimonas_sp.AAC.1